ncbi:class C sortase, partial [Pseudoflavonifractor sp. An85]|uniref:class C sortase n=1 Tax=Pseudoflavonifractor sp. An85 TaxID=1965661 RepID=UPI001179C7DF
MRETPKRKRTKRWGLWLPLILAALLIFGGAGVFFYPAVSNFIADQSHREIITTHANLISATDPEILEQEWQEAEIYNESLMGDPVHDPFVPGSGYAIPDNYAQTLDLDEVMCTLEIPKIDLSLPVYHGTSEEVLAKGIGHLEVTALPIGGLNRHAVLTGHRGLPSSELFTRLDEVEVGDIFYIHVLDEVHAYQVDQITTVEPDELENLVAEPDKDLVTLVTCTPYAVNSHRLLVRGVRVAYEPEEDPQPENEVT